mmetsp:Transcript_20906/g.49524  ORF Transcript_20906/g.49524 Transcript_20906/m.49524 type:complete len:88 (+) Transcript_20906:1074-1337(+)
METGQTAARDGSLEAEEREARWLFHEKKAIGVCWNCSCSCSLDKIRTSGQEYIIRRVLHPTTIYTEFREKSRVSLAISLVYSKGRVG